MEAPRRGRLAVGLIVLMSTVVIGSTVEVLPSAGRGLTLTRAEKAARKAVLAHPSYRNITSTRGGLLTRGCRHASQSAVRCRLYAIVPSPCSLGGAGPDTVCAQALWERRWLVRVARGRSGATTAHILRISAGPAAADVD